MNIILTYLIIINLITFIVYGIDKVKDKRSAWRISEKTLLLLAIVGGSIGAWLGIRLWRHKTMHPQFKWGVPLILLCQIGVVGYLYWRRLGG